MISDDSHLNSEYDAIIVGGGLSGCVIARKLAEELGFKILIVERRTHVGGNLYDFVDENGILVQKYGPHIFHTNNADVFQFVLKYDEWSEYRLKCMVNMCGKNTPSPFNFRTVDDYFDEEDAKTIKDELKKEYRFESKVTIVELLLSSNSVIKKYADFLFEHDYSPYTAKQWGISPSDIDISVLERVPVLLSYEDEYFSDKYQILPISGFSSFIEKMINHDNISIKLDSDFNDEFRVEADKGLVVHNGKKIHIPIVYTGELDKLLNYCFGLLPYRSLKFKKITLEKDRHQPVPIMAYPEDEKITRIVEYKQLPVQEIPNVTTLVEEYPVNYERDNEPYYPILTDLSMAKYNMYKAEVAKIPNLYVCGRLGDFKYYNMDQAIERAFSIFNEIKKDVLNPKSSECAGYGAVTIPK